MKLFWKKNLVKIIFAVLAIGMVVFSFIYFPSAQMINAGDFGIVSFVASLPDNSDKQDMVDQTREAGFGWVREEYTYTLPMNYVPFDTAYKKIIGGDLKILGLLTYPGPDKSHEIWKMYVTETVSRYPEVAAWEVMNEADNYLSAAEYTVYLKEASEIIKAKSSARIITTGITARVGDNQFWDAVKTAGGWDSFDGVATHIYHLGDPYKNTDGNGTFAQEIQKTIDSIVENGGGKKIWVTEFGFDSNEFGDDTQAQWLVESLSIMKAMPEVERGFVYRLYEHEDGLGLLAKNFSQKPSFKAVEDWFTQGAPATEESLISTKEAFETALPKAEIDKTKSLVRVDGENISSDGQEQFRVAVSLKDATGKTIIDQKPSLTVGGENTVPTDFTLVDKEWFAYVASTEAGEKSAEVKVADKELGTVKMVFGVTDLQAVSETVPAPVIEPEIIPEATSNQVAVPEPSIVSEPVVVPEPIIVEPTGPAERPENALLWFLGLESLILLLIIIVIFKLTQRPRRSQLG